MNSQPSGIFTNIQSIEDLATLLGSSKQQLIYLLYAKPEAKRYTQFTIPKRKGGSRTILAPKDDLKSIQRRLLVFLEDKIDIRASAHGFRRDRSIASNAEHHQQKRWVFNIDLKDFFPSLNFGRVYGTFRAAPFGASEKIAVILAQICCYKNSTPQGAPTSPLLSNIICRKLDRELWHLARRNHCAFTRYADDITFSKRDGQFPIEIATRNDSGELHPSKELLEIIHSNGFELNPNKINLYKNKGRQTVTGLVVNEKINVHRQFIKNLRALIHDWKLHGKETAEARHHEKYYPVKNPLCKKPPIDKIIEGKLNFLQMIRGKEDPVRRKIQALYAQVKPEYFKTIKKENNTLKQRDFFICHASEDKVDFVEPLVNEILAQGLSVWYDEYEIKLGDSIPEKINEGLTNTKYGIIVISKSFLQKKYWTEKEMSTLQTIEEITKEPHILPIWYNVTKLDILKENPTLASLKAIEYPKCSIPKIVERLKDRTLQSKGKKTTANFS